MNAILLLLFALVVWAVVTGLVSLLVATVLYFGLNAANVLAHPLEFYQAFFIAFTMVCVAFLLRGGASVKTS